MLGSFGMIMGEELSLGRENNIYTKARLVEA
jgi:hypothetical protein